MPEMSRGTVSAVARSMELLYMARSISSQRFGDRDGSHGQALFIHLHDVCMCRQAYIRVGGWLGVLMQQAPALPIQTKQASQTDALKNWGQP